MISFLGKLLTADVLILGAAFAFYKLYDRFYNKYWKPDFVKRMMFMIINTIVVFNVIFILIYVLRK